MTVYRLVAEPAADRDIEGAFGWYQNERAGLGLEFLDELRVAYGRIADGPLKYRELRSGIKLDQPTFFSWLGVTQYIDRAATDATLGFIAGQPRGSEVVFTFIVKNDLVDAHERTNEPSRMPRRRRAAPEENPGSRTSILPSWRSTSRISGLVQSNASRRSWPHLGTTQTSRPM